MQNAVNINIAVFGKDEFWIFTSQMKSQVKKKL